MRFAWYAIIVSCLFSSMVVGQAEKGRLKIGVLVPLSGDLAIFGKDLKAGMQMALEDLRVSDEDIVQRTDIEYRDYGADPSKVSTLAKELISARKADILFAPLTGSTTISLYRGIEDSSRPIISATAGHSLITRVGENVFRTCLADPLQGRVMANFAFADLKKSKVALFVEEGSEYANSVAQSFELEFKSLGGTIVTKVTYPPGTDDFAKHLAALKKKSPQLVFMPAYYADAAKAISQAKGQGLKVGFLGTDGWDSLKLYSLASREGLKGHYYFSHFSLNDSDPAVRAFIKKFMDAEKREPSMYAAMGYDAMAVALDAFKRSHTNLGGSLIKALAATKDVRSLMGALSMNSQRDAIKGASIISTTPDGPKFQARFSMSLKNPSPSL